MPRDALCSACLMHESAMNVCLWGRHEHPSTYKLRDVMVVGEAPGAKEDIEGRSFVGSAGKMLLESLKAAEINTYYLTHAVKCRPPQNKVPDTKKALKLIFDGCLPYLREEIQTVQPKFILALGNTPLKALTGETGITRWRGTPIKQDFGYGEVIVFPVYAPAYVVRGPQLEKMFRLDLGAFANLVNGKDGTDFWNPMVNHLVLKAEQIDRLLEFHYGVRDDKDVVQVYDIEAQGYWTAEGKFVPVVKRSSYNGPVCSPEEGTIPWLGIGYHHLDGTNVQYIIPWEHPKAGAKWQQKIAKLAKMVLEDKDIKRAGQNGPFDDRWLYSRGIYPERTFDDYNAAYLLDENIPHGLETIGALYMGAPPWGEGFDYSHMDTMPFAEMVDYLGKDLYATGRGYFELRKRIAADAGLARVFKHIVMPADKMLCEVQQRGLWVHEDKLAEKTATFQDKRLKLITELAQVYTETSGGYMLLDGGVDKHGKVIWNSVPQKQKILYEELGLPVFARSKKTGLPSTDKNVMARLDEETGHPLVKKLREYQKVEMLCRFLKRWREKLDKALLLRGEPRLYANYNVAKVVTGRLSADDPDGTGDNVQQIPVRGEGAELRECFGAAPGRKLIESDYSQIELRDAAFVAPEPTMKRLFIEGKDLHTHTAGIVSRKAEPTKEDRKKAKPVNFGFLFGMWAKRFVGYALTEYGQVFTLKEAERVRQAFYSEYSGLPAYYQRTEQELRTTGQVRTYTGRIRRLPDIYSPDEFVQLEAIRQAINTKIQGPANDKCLLAAIEINRRLKEEKLDAYIVALVHDAILTDSAAECVDQVAKLIKETMEVYVVKVLKTKFGVTLDIPIVAEVSIGDSWGKGEEWKGVA